MLGLTPLARRSELTHALALLDRFRDQLLVHDARGVPGGVILWKAPTTAGITEHAARPRMMRA